MSSNAAGCPRAQSKRLHQSERPSKKGISIFGLLSQSVLIGLVGAAARRLLRDDPDTRSFAFGIAALFALSGQAIHGFFDFGLYIPANVLLFALLCGAVSGRAAALTKGLPENPSPPTPFPASGASGVGSNRVRLLSPFLTASILGATLWGSPETRCVAAVETTLKERAFHRAAERGFTGSFEGGHRASRSRLGAPSRTIASMERY